MIFDTRKLKTTKTLKSRRAKKALNFEKNVMIMFREGVDSTAFTSPVRPKEISLENFDHYKQKANHENKTQNEIDHNGFTKQVLTPNENEEHSFQNVA